jgi:hypothetical protein
MEAAPRDRRPFDRLGRRGLRPGETRGDGRLGEAATTRSSSVLAVGTPRIYAATARSMVALDRNIESRRALP